MQISKTNFFAALLAATALCSQPIAAFAQTCTCPPAADSGDAVSTGASARVITFAEEPPPPLPVYEQPPIPAPGYLWTPGYWSWDGYEHFWVPGVWVQPPRPGLLWTPGYWAFAGGVYGFHRGYWGEHVGFYGGVNYGFGFGGSGYEGGRWDNGQFFYNRAVNNVRNERITNVYNQPVTANNAAANHVSFNGGPDGVNAKPTAAELAVGKETHVAPTEAQTHNARLASRNETAFVSRNKGKPPVAATAKPGVFNGESVTRASAAGGAGAESEKEKEPGPKADENKDEAQKPKGKKPELRGDEDRKPETDQAQPRKSKPEKAEPATDATPKAEERKPEPKHPKAEEPKREPPKVEDRKPEPSKAEPQRPRPPAEEAPKREAPKAEERRPEPHRPAGAEECGRPGHPACPK